MDLNGNGFQFLMSVVAGLVVYFITSSAPRLLGRWSNRRQNPHAAPTKEKDGHGIHIGSVGGDSHARIEDNRQVNNYSIEQHISEDRRRNARISSEASSEDTMAVLVALGIASVLSTLAFVLYAPVFWAVTIGSLVGLIIVTIRASLKTRKMLTEWPHAATLAVISAVIAVLGTVTTWVLIQTTTVNGLNLQNIQSTAVESMQSQEVGFFEGIRVAFSTVSNTYGLAGWQFLFFQLAAAILVVEILVIAIIHTMGWNTYLKFAHKSTGSAKAIARAGKFVEKGWAMIGLSIFGNLLAIFLASGVPFSWLASQADFSSLVGG